MRIVTKPATCIGALLLSGCMQSGASAPAETAASPYAAVQEEPVFAGGYSGNSFETAMGMRLAQDGTFEWRLSVGALDMQAKGSWQQNGDIITLTSDPKPVPARFGWSGFETVTNGPLVKVVWAKTAKPFPYASVTLTCGDGTRVSAQVPEEGWSPGPEECAEPVSLILRESIYEVRSEPYDLVANDLPEGTTVRFVFERNDLGVADFTGMTGRMEGNMLKFTGGDGLLGNGKRPQPGETVLELRKIPPRKQPDQDVQP